MAIKAKRIAIYSSLYTDPQITDKLSKLKNFVIESGCECYGEFIESSANNDNYGTELEKLLEKAENKEFDILLLWNLEHLAPKTSQLAELSRKFKSCNVDIISYEDQFNTIVPDSKLVLSYYSFADTVRKFKKNLFKKRVKDGMEKARQKGKRLGRPTISSEVFKDALKLKEAGLNFTEIGKKLGINSSTIRKKIRIEEEKNNQPKI